jgi:PhnB protein
MATINPYLIFDGNTEEAFNFYRSVFGGEFEGGLMRFKDSPEKDKVSPGYADKVLHVALRVGDTLIMGSDPPDKWHDTLNQGNNFNLSYSAKSESEVDEKFEALSEGGTVYMPVSKTFWGSYFGMLRDKFGVQWMISYDYK